MVGAKHFVSETKKATLVILSQIKEGRNHKDAYEILNDLTEIVKYFYKENGKLPFPGTIFQYYYSPYIVESVSYEEGVFQKEGSTTIVSYSNSIEIRLLSEITRVKIHKVECDFFTFEPEGRQELIPTNIEEGAVRLEIIRAKSNKPLKVIFFKESAIFQYLNSWALFKIAEVLLNHLFKNGSLLIPEVGDLLTVAIPYHTKDSWARSSGVKETVTFVVLEAKKGKWNFFHKEADTILLTKL